jgi:hypothetical protein
MSQNLVSIGGSVRRSAIVTGDRNKVELAREAASAAPRETDTEEIIRAIGALREQLENLETEDRGKILRALADAQEEAQKPAPDKEEVAGALERVIRYAKTAHGIGDVVVELQRPLSVIAGWVGTAAPLAARPFGLAA